MPIQRWTTRRGFGLLLLAAQVMQIGTDRISPVTLGTVILNAVIYMGILPKFPSVHGACTSNVNVIDKRQWERLVYSSFYHLDDMHLYFNMSSFIWKGLLLERQLKSRKFFVVIALFSILTQIVMLALNQLFAEIFTNLRYLYSCAAGFSAVVFALKVLTTVYSEDNVSIMGLPLIVPSRYVCWVELVLIQLLVPNASFTGHLAGILVGLMYTHGPLSRIVNTFDAVLSVLGQFILNGRNNDGRSYHYQSRATGYQTQPNTRRSSDSHDEQLQRAIQESLHTKQFETDTKHETRPPSYGWNIPNDDQTDNSQKIYPNLPYHAEQNYHENSPSAPLYENPNSGESSSTPSYPTFGYHPPPYPTDDYISARPPLYTRNEATDKHTSSNVGTDDVDFLRSARLRKFEKK